MKLLASLGDINTQTQGIWSKSHRYHLRNFSFCYLSEEIKMPMRISNNMEQKPWQLSIHLFLTDKLDSYDVIGIWVHFIENWIPQGAKQLCLLLFCSSASLKSTELEHDFKCFTTQDKHVQHSFLLYMQIYTCLLFMDHLSQLGNN